MKKIIATVVLLILGQFSLGQSDTTGNKKIDSSLINLLESVPRAESSENETTHKNSNVGQIGYYRIIGIVTDSLTGEPIEGVKVSTQTSRGRVVTDSTGYFATETAQKRGEKEVLRMESFDHKNYTKTVVVDEMKINRIRLLKKKKEKLSDATVGKIGVSFLLVIVVIAAIVSGG